MQSPFSWGRNVTLAVIWRKMAAISAWISGSVFSVVRGVEVALFSWSVGLEVVLDLDFEGLKIWTYVC